MELNVNKGKFAVVNETSGNVCCVDSYRARYNASRSTCYRVKRKLSQRFLVYEYRVYELVGLGRRKKE